MQMPNAMVISLIITSHLKSVTLIIVILKVYGNTGSLRGSPIVGQRNGSAKR